MKRLRSNKKQQNLLHVDGFVIHKSAINVNDEILDEIKLQAKRCDVIFNHNKKQKKNDKKRLQISLKERNKLAEKFMEELHEFLDDNYPNLIPNDAVIIKSLPGCRQQMPHTDYIPTDELNNASDNFMPLGCIVAVMPMTYLYVWPKSIRLSTKTQTVIDKMKPIKPVKLELQPGDVIIFRGDLVHAGAEYQTHNYRIHTYLDSPKVNREYNRTWFADNMSCIC